MSDSADKHWEDLQLTQIEGPKLKDIAGTNPSMDEYSIFTAEYEAREKQRLEELNQTFRNGAVESVSRLDTAENVGDLIDDAERLFNYIKFGKTGA